MRSGPGSDMQQTGFNWSEWGPGRVVQVDVDEAELTKGHPRVDVPIQADANRVLALLDRHAHSWTFRRGSTSVMKYGPPCH